MYIDDLLRKGTPKVAGRGAAMSTNHTSSDKQKIRCFNCHKRGHRKSECTQPKRRSSTPAAAGSAKTKWCSTYRSATHSDAECKAQRNGQDGTNASVAARGTESPPAPTGPEVELSGFSFMTSTRPNEAPQSDSVLLLVDSGYSDHYFDDTIIRGLENHRLNVEVLRTPRTISTVGNPILMGTRSGTLLGTRSANSLTDAQNGKTFT